MCKARDRIDRKNEINTSATAKDYGFNSEGASEAAAPVTGTGRVMRRLAGWFSRGHDRMAHMATWVRRRTLWSDGAERRGENAVAILERQDQIMYVMLCLPPLHPWRGDTGRT